MIDPFLIETRRLVLKPLQIEDADAVFRYRSNRQVNRYQGWIPESIDDVYDFINNRIFPTFNVTETWFQFAIFLRQNRILIGDTGLHFLGPDSQQVELGCTLDKDFQGQGYAEEALTEIAYFLFQTYHKKRLIAVIDPDNRKSVRLFEKLGFQLAGKDRSQFIRDEHCRDQVFTLSDKDWMKR